MKTYGRERTHTHTHSLSYTYIKYIFSVISQTVSQKIFCITLRAQLCYKASPDLWCLMANISYLRSGAVLVGISRDWARGSPGGTSTWRHINSHKWNVSGARMSSLPPVLSLSLWQWEWAVGSTCREPWPDIEMVCMQAAGDFTRFLTAVLLLCSFFSSLVISVINLWLQPAGKP